jgi:sugar phosphate isomerase/epimerase
MCEGCQIRPTEQQASALSRRRMLGVAAAGVAGAAALTALGTGTAMAGGNPATPADHHGGGGGARRIPVEQISIQLYTLRDLMAADLEGTLTKLAGIGFKKVEHAGVPTGLTAKQFRTLLDSLGLRSTSGHNDTTPIAAPFDSARRAAWQQVLDTANVLGQKAVNLSVVGASFAGGLTFFNTAEQWKALCDVLNQAGRMARASGLRLGLHNHFWEFLPLLDSHLVGSDFLISQTDPRYVHFEIDLYWAHYAHHDPVQIISDIQDRVTQFHVKDMKLLPVPDDATGPSMTFTDPGTGVIDFRRIFAAKTASPRNTEYIIERDDAGQGALTTAKAGFDLLKGIRF